MADDHIIGADRMKERTAVIQSEMDARFGTQGDTLFFRSPGRVDLMGSHTDYNEGLVLTCTVDRDILAGARGRRDGVVNLYSLNFDHEVRVNVDSIFFDSEHGWANYAKGVISELLELKVPVEGLDLVVQGEIPVGANLSSSAALEAVVCEAVLGVCEHELAVWERIRLCQRSESVFVGMPCGIMDQFSVFMGDLDTALLLDCRTLTHREIPFSLEGVSLVVIDSGRGRELVGSMYSERVDECKRAVRVLRGINPDVKSLRDVELEEVDRARPELGDVLFRRARHVVTENERVLAAGKALGARSYEALGEIMEACFASCRDDYENSTSELEALHGLLAGREGVYGVRICGAGWGGCLLGLVDSEYAGGLGRELGTEYQKGTGLSASVWEVHTSPGAGFLSSY